MPTASKAPLPVWYVYIVRCADRSLYTGVALNPRLRLEQHNAGTGAKYTRGRRPVELVYLEALSGRGDALRRESRIKRMAARDKRRLIAQSDGADLSKTQHGICVQAASRRLSKSL